MGISKKPRQLQQKLCQTAAGMATLHDAVFIRIPDPSPWEHAKDVDVPSLEVPGNSHHPMGIMLIEM